MNGGGLTDTVLVHAGAEVGAGGGGGGGAVGGVDIMNGVRSGIKLGFG